MEGVGTKAPAPFFFLILMRPEMNNPPGAEGRVVRALNEPLGEFDQGLNWEKQSLQLPAKALLLFLDLSG
jgi:hypothetical protein